MTMVSFIAFVRFSLSSFSASVPNADDETPGSCAALRSRNAFFFSLVSFRVAGRSRESAPRAGSFVRGRGCAPDAGRAPGVRSSSSFPCPARSGGGGTDRVVMMWKRVVFLCVVVLGVTSAREARAAWTSQGAVDSYAPDAMSYLGYGEGVALSGDIVVAGEPGKTQNGCVDHRGHGCFSSGGGNAYVRTQSGTWSVATALAPAQYTASASFGSTVDVDGRYAVFGAERTDISSSVSDVGVAYVFTYDDNSQTWSSATELQANTRNADDLFGFSVAISGDTIAVGAPGVDSKGCVFTFERSGSSWVRQTAKIQPSDIVARNNFGNAVAMHGNTMIVGTMHHNYPAGAAYIFTRASASSPWAQEQKIDGASNDEFGARVSVSGDTVAIVAESGSGSNQVGSVFVYTRTSGRWSQQQNILSPSGASGFGASMALSGDLLVVGAPNTNLTSDPTLIPEGVAYIFQRDSSGVWNQLARLEAHDGTSVDTSHGAQFGCSADVDGNTVIIGAYGYSTPSHHSAGRAYIYRDPSVSNVERLPSPSPSTPPPPDPSSTPSQTSPTIQDKPKFSTAFIAAISCASAVFFILVVVVLTVVFRRRRTRMSIIVKNPTRPSL